MTVMPLSKNVRIGYKMTGSHAKNWIKTIQNNACAMEYINAIASAAKNEWMRTS